MGLPLTAHLIQRDGLLVTICHSNKPVAEGVLVWPHLGFITPVDDAVGTTRRINITASRSLVRLTSILTPGYIHALHSQSIEWINDHGQDIVVTTSTLRTRNSQPPLSSLTLNHAFSAPAPPSSSASVNDEPLVLSTNTLDLFTADSESLESDSELENGDDDTYLLADDANPSPVAGMDCAGNPSQSSTNTGNSNVASDSDSPVLPTRILDDPFHFMDRLLRLLSKKHSVFRAFAHDFSEAIFIRDKDDVARVLAVLTTKGIDWEYAKRGKAAALNRRIRRYIPSREILVKRLETLFNAYKDIRCTVQTGKSRRFFSKEAEEMSVQLLQTAQRGFLSDPPGICLYYRMGIDRNGLIMFRTIRGTNSVEGGVHMTVRRVFGSLQASPELAECLLLNWILRRNKTVLLFFPNLKVTSNSKFRLDTTIALERSIMVISISGSLMRLLSLLLNLVSSHPSLNLPSLSLALLHLRRLVLLPSQRK